MRKYPFLLLLSLTIMITILCCISSVDAVASNKLYTYDTYPVVLSGIGGLPAEWQLTHNGLDVELPDYIEGELGNTGGNIRFKQKGLYVLTACVTDLAGREFVTISEVMVYPIPVLNFDISSNGYINVPINVTTNFVDVDQPVLWTLEHNGDSAGLTSALNNNGGSITFTQTGNYDLTVAYTDATGRPFEETKTIRIDPDLNCDFSVQSTNLHLSKSILVTMDSAAFTGDKNIIWSLTRSSSAVNYTGTLNNSGGSINVNITGSYTLKASITDNLGQTITCSKSFSMYNNPPSTPVITRTPSGALINAFDSVSINATATDPDSDSVNYTWENRSGSYPEGTHTVRCKASDKWGAESAWASITFSTAYIEQTVSYNFRYPNETRYIYQLTPKKYIKHITIYIPSFSRQAGDFHEYYVNLFDSWGNKEIEYANYSFSSQQVIELDFPYKQYTYGNIRIYTNILSLDGKQFTYKITYHD